MLITWLKNAKCWFHGRWECYRRWNVILWKKSNMLMKIKHDFMELKKSIHKILISWDILVHFHMEDLIISTCSFLVKMLISWLKKNKCWFYGKKEFWKKMKHDFMEVKARLDIECWKKMKHNFMEVKARLECWKKMKHNFMEMHFEHRSYKQSISLFTIL